MSYRAALFGDGIGATLAVSKLAGRGASSGSGVYEEIALGTNLSMSGNTLNASGGGGTITLSGDVSGSGTAAITTTLATVNSNTGTFGGAATVAQISVNGKGLITGVTAVTIAIPQSAVTNLVADLAGKQASGSYSLTSHNHDASYSALGHTHSYEPTIAAGTTAQYWRGDKTWQTLPGGSDPWAYLKVSGADFSTTLATWTTITGLTFTPPANSTIEIEAVILISTATATVGPRPALSWGTGLLAGAVTIDTPTSATARALVNGSVTTVAGNAQAPVGGLPIVNRTYYASIEAVILTGASPQAINVQLASETAGTAVKAQLGSFLKWRTI